MNRELDILIAQHLFGWDVDYIRDDWVMGYPPVEQTAGIDAERHPVPEYSCDWRGMQRVVTKLRERGYVITMKLDQTGWSVLAYHRTIIDGLTYDENDVFMVGPELPELVARAALKALGVPVETP